MSTYAKGDHVWVGDDECGMTCEFIVGNDTHAWVKPSIGAKNIYVPLEDVHPMQLIILGDVINFKNWNPEGPGDV